MPLVIKDGTPEEQAYQPPPQTLEPKRTEAPAPGEDFARVLSNAIVTGFKDAVGQWTGPVINVPKPEVKINSPVYVTAPDVKIPATTVNVPEGKAPVVNIEPATVTLQTNRPNKWKFTFERDEFGRMTTAWCEDVSVKK